MKKKLLLSVLMCFFIFVSYSQNAFWRETSNDRLVAIPKSDRDAMPSEYKLFSLDYNAFKAQLQFAPSRENSAFITSNVIIQFPNADGIIEYYRIYEASVMHPDLASKYPDIKSYVGKGITDPTATIRFSTTIFGLHTMTTSGLKGTQYIDTYTKDLNNYIVYEKNKLSSPRTRTCLVDTITESKGDLSKNSTSELIADGTFRTYRLAMACTIEYAAFHVNAAGLGAGTLAQKKAAVLAAMNVSMTRINGLYEKDMSLTMQLVANNDLVIFIDSDNFNNTAAGTLINQSQTVIDANIGFSNYDIGHTVSTGGGGLAQLFSPCSSSKARGITGSPAPVGDPFDIDYVAHEMGHQFGANHTQNNNCNRNGATAIEPGSASTIMGYAGICAPNVQSNSDAHFQAISIAEMTAFVTSGGNCGVNIANNNAAPVVNAGPDYTIPNNTAFILKGAATDSNGDALTYCWEQMNTEPSTQPPLQTSTNGPNFRSNPPISSPDRYMPTLSSVINNNLAPTWEVVPNVARTMNFALTVRDNRIPNGGQTGRDNMVVTTAAVGPFLVNTPNTAVSWVAGTNQNVTWTVAGTTANNINSAFVDILLSTDGGFTYPILLASKVPNDGAETITVPNNPGTTNRIMVRGYNHIFYDLSNVNFTITAPTSSFGAAFSGVAEQQYKSACQGTSVSYNISYSALAGFSGTTTFAASGFPTGSTVTFAPTSISTTGTVVMTISNTNSSPVGVSNIIVTATSGAITRTVPFYLELFSSNFPAMSLTSPANNAIGQSTALNLTWAANPNASSYDVQVATNNTFTAIVSSGNVTATTYSVSGLLSNTDYFWRVLPKNAICGDGTFSSAFTFKTGLIACNTTASTNVPIAISASGAPTITSTITIASGGVISDLNVLAQITHAWISDLTVSITSPAGTTVQLVSEQCDDSDNMNATFDDAGVALVCGTAPAIAGTIIPAQALSAFNGQSSTGTWTLTVSDGYNQDGGSLTGWSLNICATAPLAVNENLFQDFAIYPNPNNGNFTVMFNTVSSENVNVDVYDMRGRQIYKNEFANSGAFNQNINLDAVQAGVYLVLITNGESKIVKRIIIE